MIAIVTRVKNAQVTVNGEAVGVISGGFLCLLGVHREDTEKDAAYMADRLWGLRIFEDADGRMNLSPQSAGQTELLIVSQFTLFGDVSQRRPSFSAAAPPEQGRALYEKTAALCRDKGFTVQTGIFGAEMQVYSQNDGPVTLIVDTNKRSRAND